MQNILTRNTIIRISIVLLLSMLDYILTCYAVNTGIASEANPVLSSMSLEMIGIAKTIGLLALFYWAWNRKGLLTLVSFVLMAVVVWNTAVIILY